MDISDPYDKFGSEKKEQLQKDETNEAAFCSSGGDFPL